MQRPPEVEVPEYFRQYTNLVADGDVLAILGAQIEETTALLRGVDEERADFRYAEGKWSIKEILGHLADSERVFAYRALSFARGETTSLPGYDHDSYVQHADLEERSLQDVVSEYGFIRRSNIALFEGFSERAWVREGSANGIAMKARVVPYILAGHELHHRSVLQERYEI